MKSYRLTQVVIEVLPTKARCPPITNGLIAALVVGTGGSSGEGDQKYGKISIYLEKLGFR